MIGVYGGTFNPVHYGHLRTALEVSELFRLDELRLIPCRIPAHRDQPTVSGEMRLHMLQLAIADTPGLLADRRELDRDGPSYMLDTLQSLRQELGAERSILLFVGADAFAGLTQWHQYRRLFDYAHIVVMTRPGFDHPVLAEGFRQRLFDRPGGLQSRAAGGLFFQTVTLLDISATRIRAIIAAGRSPQFLLPPQVLAFIRQHQLYRNHPLTTGN
ncbi:MAG: nicotinate-nucleotide adenylyltransferase [Methylococcales bacterium]|nr:nicotinate-nucleotide adenylyltransferase [Methylococcales bacterium]